MQTKDQQSAALQNDDQAALEATQELVAELQHHKSTALQALGDLVAYINDKAKLNTSFSELMTSAEYACALAVNREFAQ